MDSPGDQLLRVSVNIISAEECDTNLSDMPGMIKKLPQVIDYNTMVCSGNGNNGKNTCAVSFSYF